jgi:hypothetical protein
MQKTHFNSFKADNHTFFYNDYMLIILYGCFKRVWKSEHKNGMWVLYFEETYVTINDDTYAHIFKRHML